jgi:hypothetical protein
MITLVDRIRVWNVLVDESPLLAPNEHREHRAEFNTKMTAITSGFDFVYKLSVDEGKIMSAGVEK